MIGMYAIAAIGFLAAGAMVAILTLVVVAIHREERAWSLGNANPGPFASGIRAVVSYYTDDHASSRRRA